MSTGQDSEFFNAAKVRRRQAADAERLKRFMNPQLRTSGIDPQVLNEQVMAKNALVADEKAFNRSWDSLLMKNDKVASLIHAQNTANLRQQIQDVCQENAANIGTSISRSLNDPDAWKSLKPERTVENEHDLGPSCLQKFDGEKLEISNEQKRSIMATQRQWLDAQVAAKNLKKSEEKHHEDFYAQQTSLANELRRNVENANRMNQHEVAAKTRQELEQQHEENLKKQQLAKEVDEARSQKDIETHLTSEFLNESRRTRMSADFKGMTADQRQIMYDTLDIQRDEQIIAEEQEQNFERQWAMVQKNSMNLMAAVEHQKNSAESSERQDLDRANAKIKIHHAQKMKDTTKMFANEMTESFFDQFNTSCR